jgi:hypothetical protein
MKMKTVGGVRPGAALWLWLFIAAPGFGALLGFALGFGQ